MKSIASALTPNATNQIRFDHTQTLTTFHQFKTDSRPQVKLGLVNTACLWLEVHAQLEEEIFYPALRAVSDIEALKKSVPEHSEMKRLIALLRGMKPDDARYDDTYRELMRDVIHHVADEETIVLPEAERLIPDQLDDLGLKMTKRRLELVAPRSGDIAVNMARAMSGPSMAVVGSALVAGLLIGRRWLRR